MGLFATLTSSAVEAGKARSSNQVPCIVQLYSKSPILVGSSAKSRKFSILSYEAAHVGALAETGGGALLSSKQEHVEPNLGVWNFRVTKPQSGQKGITDDVFGSLPSVESPCFCMSVDMTDLAQVEPTISMLQDALVRYLISRGNKTSEKPAAATTTLFDLRSVFFGLADNDKDSAKSVHANPDAADKNVYVSLVISVLIPSRTEAAAAYKEKQAEALVMYHLRKYAASLNAVLCFVRTEEPVEEGKAIDALSIHQLSHVWHQLAKGEEGWKQFDTTTTTASEETEETPADTPPAETVMGVYGPGSHQEDLIESVLLRNAHFPGQWDASNDSLWVALPSATDDATANAAADAPADGDESWLRELRSSVTSEAVKTPPATAKGDSAADTAKTPNDAELSSFFDSLLKP